jgi:hypothetical protein
VFFAALHLMLTAGKGFQFFQESEERFTETIPEAGMVTAEQPLASQETMQRSRIREDARRRTILPTTIQVIYVLALLGVGGCGQTAKTVTPPSANLVFSYFGGPFNVSASNLPQSISKFDHSANGINVSSFIATATAQVPSPILSGTFATAPTGFLNITETFATTSSGIISPQNALAGAWAVEIPGAGALANLLNVNTSTGGVLAVTAAPTAMAENSACPNFSQPARLLYVTVPNTSITNDTADYGNVDITTQGSAVTLSAHPSLIGPTGPTAGVSSIVTGGCSDTIFGSLTAYPLNSFGGSSAASSNLELIALSQSGLLVSSFNSGTGSSPGAFGGGTGVIGFAEPSSPVDLNTVVSGHYNGFIYAPQNNNSNNNVPLSYDITVLASAFGDKTATSQACSTLQSSLVDNNGQGAKTVATLPSAASLYGGEFLVGTGASTRNDPTGANGSENCDLVIDLGTQDSANNGLFPHATIFIGSDYPPFSASTPWTCFNATCAASFPAVAVVGQVQGQYVIFVVASAASNPHAQLPNNSGNNNSANSSAQPVGIYLFQKSQ